MDSSARVVGGFMFAGRGGLGCWVGGLGGMSARSAAYFGAFGLLSWLYTSTCLAHSSDIWAMACLSFSALLNWSYEAPVLLLL